MTEIEEQGLTKEEQKKFDHKYDIWLILDEIAQNAYLLYIFASMDDEIKEVLEYCAKIEDLAEILKQKMNGQIEEKEKENA